MSDEFADSGRMIAFVDEAETAIMLLDEGIRIVESWDGGADRRVVALHLMAQGYERYFKLTLALALLRRTGRLPSAHEAQRWGHGLLKLLDMTLDEFHTVSSFVDRPAVREDIASLRQDGVARQQLGILDEFASGGRYHDLDVMLDGHSRAEHPVDRWSALETDLFQQDDRWIRLMQDDPAGFGRCWYPYLASAQVHHLQRTARTLARAWTLGPASDEGKRRTGIVRRFLFLTDDVLGNCPPR